MCTDMEATTNWGEERERDKLVYYYDDGERNHTTEERETRERVEGYVQRRSSLSVLCSEKSHFGFYY